MCILSAVLVPCCLRLSKRNDKGDPDVNQSPTSLIPISICICTNLMAPTESTFFPAWCGVQDRLHNPPAASQPPTPTGRQHDSPAQSHLRVVAVFTTSVLGQSLCRGTLSGAVTHSEGRVSLSHPLQENKNTRQEQQEMENNKTFPAVPDTYQPIGGSWLGDIPPNTPLRGERLCFLGSGEGAKQRWLRHLHGTPRGLLASPSDSRCPGPQNLLDQ